MRQFVPLAYVEIQPTAVVLCVWWKFYLFIINKFMHTAKVKQKIARIEANTNLLPTRGRQKQYMHIYTYNRTCKIIT